MSEFDITESDEVNRQGEKNDGIPIPTVQNLRRLEAVISGSSSQPRIGVEVNDLDPTPCQEDKSRVDDPRYKSSVKVYTRRKYKSQEEVPAIVTPTTHEHSSSAPQEIIDVSSTSEAENEDSAMHDLPIALRKGARVKAGVPPSMYGFEHDIENYVSYASSSAAYRAFIAYCDP
jgi:hypothetical protein